MISTRHTCAAPDDPNRPNPHAWSTRETHANKYRKAAMAPTGAVVAVDMARGHITTHAYPCGMAVETAEAALAPLPGAIGGPGSGASLLATSYARC